MSIEGTFAKPWVSVPVVVFGLEDGDTLKVLLIRQGSARHSIWALPGYLLQEDEVLEVAARRGLREVLHAEPDYLEQLATFESPIQGNSLSLSVAYMALVRCESVTLPEELVGEKPVRWFHAHISKLPGLDLGQFDIFQVALKRLRSKIRWQPIGMGLLPTTFTLTDLQKVYETILGQSLDKRNFRRRVLSYGVLESVESLRIGAPGRRPHLYRFNQDAYLDLVERGIDFEV